MKNVKKIINCHIEELIMKTIDEQELITKKKEWREKGFKLKNHGKEKIEFILLTGKITISRTILQIVGTINLEDYNLKSKLIIPLDEYLGIDKLPFKVSIKAMIKIAFWG